MSSEKIYVIGLPRTGTTSLCVAMLDLGYSVAHTAYTDKAMNQAQVIADTPIFCDYQQLDLNAPNAKFIYLRRDLDLWLPSIRQLLQRMFKNLTRMDGGFNPTLKRCYAEVFSPLSLASIATDRYLINCYQRHEQGIMNYFEGRMDDLLVIDVSQTESYQKLLDFLKSTNPLKKFEKINIGGKVTAWNKIKHPLKVDANLK